MTIYIIDLEPVESRYTAQWKKFIEQDVISGQGLNSKVLLALFLFIAYVVLISEQGGKILKIIKRAGSNRKEQDGKNLENS